ncbi:hypothetical protein KUTeg_018660 [Tegillarca granosa]|uniref:HAT C-terminal dimerisation domain-containing protein n=1 Tax=Tegillarca granosa TaxID=220873 RepID=A0ABQ9EIH4_TEGGR|nr:hypothetical protein KUTeg_018660 [Tegillarca granosa]
MTAFESIQEVIEGVEKSRFKQVFATRWLSFEGSVHAVVRNYSSLISVFLEENSAKALSLYKPVSTYKFLFCAHFLSDVLKQLCFLSKMYQKSDLDFSQVNPLLSSTIVVLENLSYSKCGSCCPSEPMLDSDGLYTFQFKGHTIRDRAQQRKEAVSSCEAFVDHTVSNLKERFSDGKDAKIMSAMCAVLNPSLDGQLSSDDVTTVGDYLSSCGIKDSACFAQELSSFNGYVKVQVNKNSESVNSVKDVAQLGLKLLDIFPVVGIMCKRFLTLAVSTVDCESGFSRQNLIKTCQRNRLKEKTLDNLFRISMDDQRENIDFDNVFKVWAGVKPRRILN